MEISSVFENEYCSKIETLTGLGNMAEWNGRTIKSLAGNESSVLSQVINIKTKMPPMMSKPTSLDAEATGGYSEERGGYIEGRISASWGESKSSSSGSKPSSSETRNDPSNDSDSSDN